MVGAERSTPGVFGAVTLTSQVECVDVEPLGASILHMPIIIYIKNSSSPLLGFLTDLPSKRILASKKTTAIVALVIALLHVDALMMSLQIRFSNKLLATAVGKTREGVLSLFIMRLHVRLEVVTPTKEFATSIHFALKVGFLLCRVLARWALGPGYPHRMPVLLELCRLAL